MIFFAGGENSSTTLSAARHPAAISGIDAPNTYHKSYEREGLKGMPMDGVLAAIYHKSY